MKSVYAGALCVLLLLACGCGQTVNDQADIKAINDLIAGYSKAATAKDTAFFETTYYQDDAFRLPPNSVPVKGKDAIINGFKTDYANTTYTGFTLPVDEVLTSGDLAIARGSSTGTTTPTAGGLPANSDPVKWIGVYKRQADGAWKCAFDMWNSDAPATGATADGVEEQALYQLERDWAAAAMKKDTAVIDGFLAKDFVSNYGGKTENRAQLLAQIKSNRAEVESIENSDMVAMVFGDTAVVRGVYTEKSMTNGKDSSTQGRYTEVYKKRDGRWQCVTQFAESIKP